MIRIILTFVFIFLLSFKVVTDTDFGWHVRVGEYIYNNHTVPNTDLFSFSLPNHSYTYHSWASQLFIFLSYKAANLIGVSVFFAVISTLTMFFIYKIIRLLNGHVNLLYLLWVTPLAFSITGGRTRIFGFFFFALIYYIYLKNTNKIQKSIWFIPLLFLFWANFHGSFVLGLAAFLILIVSQYFFDKIPYAQFEKLLLVFITSVLATLVNPYFINLWIQVISLSTNTVVNIQSVNPDWQPLIFNSGGWIFALIVTLILTVVWFFKNPVSETNKIALSIFFILSLVSSRFALIVITFFVPICHQLISQFTKKLPKQTPNFVFVNIIVLLISVNLPLLAFKNILEINFAYQNFSNYAQYIKKYSPPSIRQRAYSYQANIYIINNLKGKRILNESNWGSFMILLDPQRKVFYHSAMDNYKIKSVPFPYEYLSIVNAQDNYEQKLENFEIEAVFLPVNFPLVKKLSNNHNWNSVYRDDLAEILVKVNNL